MKQQIQSLFNKNNPKLTILNVAYLLFLTAFLFNLIKSLVIYAPYDSFTIGEFLINYQGGFVRRGLLGEILYFFVKHFNINIILTIKIISFICFSAVSLFFIKSFIKKGYTLYILPLCFFMGAIVLNSPAASIIKKDCLMICFLIIILWIFNKNNLSEILKILLINLFAITIILTHEVFALISLPMLFLLFSNKFKEKGFFKSIVFSGISLLPSILVFLFVLFMHGNQEISEAIWNSWTTILNLPQSKANYLSAIASIGWDSKWTYTNHLRLNFLDISDSISVFVFSCVIFPTIYYIVTNSLLVFRKNENDYTNLNKNSFSSILIFQLVCLTPLLTILSCDYNRIIFYWISSSFVIFILCDIEQIIPPFYARFINFINKNLSAILRPTKTSIVFLMMFIGVSPWSIRLDLVMFSTMIYNIFFTLTHITVVIRKVILLFINLF